jgi:hypothetical protein
MAFRRALLALTVAALAVGVVVRPARAADLPPRNQALLLLRILAYDRNITKRAGKTVSVLVLARQGDHASEERARQLVGAFEEVAREVVVAGLPVKAEMLLARDAAALDSGLESSPAALVFVDEAFAPAVPDLARVTRRRGALSAGGSREFAEAGLAVAVVLRQARASVVVNLQAARQEGADLASALLAVAELVRE